MFFVLSHSINKQGAIDIADPGSMQDACDVFGLAHQRVSVAQW